MASTTTVTSRKICTSLGMAPTLPRTECPRPAFGAAGDPGDDSDVVVVGSPRSDRQVATIRVRGDDGGRLVVAADGPVEIRRHPGGTALSAALAAWATDLAGRLDVSPPRPAPTIWCS